ncbi:MAG: amidase [Caldilineaceae bacterium]
MTEAYLARRGGQPGHQRGDRGRPDAALCPEADAKQAAGEALGPLHGVPFSVKDVFAVPGLYSRIDTHIRQRAQPREDAVAVARLRTAGAILLGKTNCPPNGSGTDAENAIYGQTVNPYDHTRVAGGSSGGDAALVAAGGAAFAIGSDQRGGLRIPAAYCGVTCLKPTYGRVPNTGAYNQPGGLTDPRTQIGPITRHTEDLLPIAQVLSGPDAADSTVVPMGWRNPAHVDLSTLRVAFFVSSRSRRWTMRSSRRWARPHRHWPAPAPPCAPTCRCTSSITATKSTTSAGHGRRPGAHVGGTFAIGLLPHRHAPVHAYEYDAILCPVDHHVAPPVRQRIPCASPSRSASPASRASSCAPLPVLTACPWRPNAVTLARKTWPSLASALERELGWTESERLEIGRLAPSHKTYLPIS